MPEGQRLSRDYSIGRVNSALTQSHTNSSKEETVHSSSVHIVRDIGAHPRELPKIRRTETTKLAGHNEKPKPLADVRKVTPDTNDWRSVQPALPRQSRSKVLHRSMFGPKIAEKTRAKIRRQNRRLLPGFKAAAVFLFLLLIVSTGIGVNTVRINRINNSQTAVLARNKEKVAYDGIDESEPDSATIANYQVAPDLPRYLHIPKIQVNARITRLGIASNSGLDAPDNIYDIGWYENSAKPGDNGAILLEGQVIGPTKAGVFYSLGSLQVGDDIEVDRGDGKIFHYQVVGQQLYDYDQVDMRAALNSAVPGKPGLNLMSYSRRFDARTNKFEQQLIVFTVQK